MRKIIINEALYLALPPLFRIYNKDLSEYIKAFVVFKEGKTSSEEELIEFCRTKLTGYKVPKEIEFRDELPKSLIGKILRRELKNNQ